MRGLLGMLAFIVLTNAGILVVTHQVMPQRDGWGLFGGWLLNLIVIAVSAGIVGKSLGTGGGTIAVVILLAIFALVYGMLGGHIPRALRLRESPVLKMDEIEIDRVTGYDVWHFSDGRIDLNLLGTREIRGGKRPGTLYYYAAPVVAPDWKKDEHVTAWVVHSSMDPGTPASWKKDCRGGYDPGLDENYRILVEETSRTRKLATLPNAPILICSDDPKKDFLGAAWFEFGALILIDLVGIVTAILGAMKPELPPS